MGCTSSLCVQLINQNAWYTNEKKERNVMYILGHFLKSFVSKRHTSSNNIIT